MVAYVKYLNINQILPQEDMNLQQFVNVEQFSPAKGAAATTFPDRNAC